MLLINVEVKNSPRDGLGLFAAQDIPKGTVTWKYDPRIDLMFTPEEVEHFPKVTRDFFDHYAYISKTSGKYILEADNARFTNHSKHNNIDLLPAPPGEQEFIGVANRDIAQGEELLTNYQSFDAFEAASNESFLHT